MRDKIEHPFPRYKSFALGEYISSTLAALGASDLGAEQSAAVVCALKQYKRPEVWSAETILRRDAFHFGTWLGQQLQALLAISVPADRNGAPFDALEVSTDGRPPTRLTVPEVAEGGATFLFRYPIATPIVDLSGVSDAPLAVGEILHDLLWIQGLDGKACVRGRPNMIAEFDFGARTSRRTRAGEIHPLHGVAQTEPLIIAIARHWGVLSGFIQGVDAKGDRHKPETFVLRDTRDWVVVSEYAKSPTEMLSYLARVCNVSCEFCYLFGNPETVSIARGAKTISRDEMNARLELFSPERRESLFDAIWELNEVIVDPKFESVARDVRNRSETPFYIVTNGNPLTPQKIAFLEEVKPVQLIVSTNSIEPELRSEIMNERSKQTSVALGCFDDLERAGIEYGISMVAFPGEKSSDLKSSILAIDKYNPAFIRINLVGYTRDHPARIEFDTFDFWRETVEWIRELRHQVETPLMVIPSAFEENFFFDNPNAARVIGTVKGSAGARAGLRPDDEIIAVGAFKITNRAQVRGLLGALVSPTPLRVRRQGEEVSLTLDPTVEPQYPNGPTDFIAKYHVPKGVVLAPALSSVDFASIRAQAVAGGWHRVVLITSLIMRPAVAAFVDDGALGDLDVEIVVVRNDFLGGNIMVLDMATVGDVVAAVRRQLGAEIDAVDQIFMPGTSFNEMGRDLSGRHWHDIEAELSVPVTLLDATTRFAF